MSGQTDCLFCKIVEGTIPSTKVYEDERVLGFRDIQPQAKEHILFIPKKHIPTMNDVSADDWPLIADLLKAAQQTAREIGIAESGYRLVNNCNKEGGQVVYHLHVHLLGGEPLGKING
jgi:histidine triad (HIT) family protein